MRDALPIVVEEVTLRRGGRDVLVDVSFIVRPGVVALVGPNGAGKSSLLRALAGVAMPHRGRIAIAGHDLRRDPVRAKRALGFQPQGADLFPYLTPIELLRTFASVRGVVDDGVATFAALTSERVVDVPIATLSAGQRRKLTLVAALQGDPTVLLLDEPDDALDAPARTFLVDRVAARKAAGAAVVIATHRPDDLGLAIDRRLVVNDGRVQEAAATPEDH